MTAILEVSKGALRACDGIAAAYAPDEELISTWGHRLEWMKPLGPCGRCPGCRAMGVEVAVDPPPRPRQRWSVESTLSDEFRSFLISARGQHGMAVLVERSGEDLGDSVAAALIGQGVLHIAGNFGLLPAPPLGTVLFRDNAPLVPRDLSPLSSFSRFGPADSISPRWLSRRASPRHDLSGQEVVDVLLVPEGARIGGQGVGRDIPMMLGVTALELLRKA